MPFVISHFRYLGIGLLIIWVWFYYKGINLDVFLGLGISFTILGFILWESFKV